MPEVREGMTGEAGKRHRLKESMWEHRPKKVTEDTEEKGAR